jgi:hypothetical protein
MDFLERLESKPYDEKNEYWLQGLIFENPKILPAQEFDESFTPLIPIGQEVGTPSGSIDILYISPVGKLTIVETKLWKSPEKHRTVVAQIIDYAKEISNWSYEELNNAVLKASRDKGMNEKKSLDQIIQQYLEVAGLTLADFQDRVISNLKNGEFLLLIIGDRISPNVALLSDAIHGAPGLNFTMGLIELQLHQINKGKDWPLLVLPDIVGRPIEKTRGVIIIQYEKEKPKVEVKVSEEESKGKITQEVFLQKAPRDLQPVYEQWLEIWRKTKNALVYWGTSGFSYRVRIKGKLETILEAYPEWAISLIREIDAERCKASQEQYQEYLNNINDIPVAANILGSGRKYVKHDSVTAEDLQKILKAGHDFSEGVKDS